MHAVEHALRYLRSFFYQSLKFSRDTPLIDTIWGWVDSDWAGDTDTRRSQAVYVLMLNGGPISWKNRQDSVALSTSEDVAASEVGKEIQYLWALSHEVGSTQLQVDCTQIHPSCCETGSRRCFTLALRSFTQRFTLALRSFTLHVPLHVGSTQLHPTNAEYMAASEVGKQSQYLRAVVYDVGSTQLHPTNVTLA
jgi:hypothetical protein